MTMWRAFWCQLWQKLKAGFDRFGCRWRSLCAAESVCVTRAACLGEVAKHFQVEGAYDRGHRAHNPHVRRLNNSEVKSSVIKHRN